MENPEKSDDSVEGLTYILLPRRLEEAAFSVGRFQVCLTRKMLQLGSLCLLSILGVLGIGFLFHSLK